MKNLTKLLGLSLAFSALLFTACAKKPIRPDPGATAMGPASNNSVDPTQVAVEPAAPGTNLEARNLPPGVTEDENTIRGLLQPVNFAFDRSAVDAKERPKIEAAVKYLKDNPDKRMLLEGHCDWRGTAEYNLGLGDRRATAVRRYLESLGIDSKRLETLSKGSTDAKQGGTAADWEKDRRTDFVVLKK
ncbi:MAG: OmpA family protein [Opitutae bacterium]|nr:OmpA family protein [Opitutae bacterium]